MTSSSSNESHSPSPSSGSEHERSGGGGGGKAKKHVCPTCDRAFTTSGHLARHARVHTGERNHHCPFPGCNTRCSRQDNLQQHYRVHLSPRSRNISTSAARAEMARRALAQQQQQQVHPPPLAASQLPQFADAPFLAARPVPTSGGGGWWPDSSSSPSTHAQSSSSSYYSMSYAPTTPSPSPYTTPSPDAAYFRTAPHSLDAYVPPAPLPLGARFYTHAPAHAQQPPQPYPWNLKVEDRQAY